MMMEEEPRCSIQLTRQTQYQMAVLFKIVLLVAFQELLPEFPLFTLVAASFSCFCLANSVMVCRLSACSYELCHLTDTPIMYVCSIYISKSNSSVMAGKIINQEVSTSYGSLLHFVSLSLANEPWTSFVSDKELKYCFLSIFVVVYELLPLQRCDN